MTQRAPNRWLVLAAHAVGSPSLAAAFMLYFFATWTPDARGKRDLLCACLVVVGIGAALVEGGKHAAWMRVTGGVTMLLGAAGVAAVFAW